MRDGMRRPGDASANLDVRDVFCNVNCGIMTKGSSCGIGSGLVCSDDFPIAVV